MMQGRKEDKRCGKKQRERGRQENKIKRVAVKIDLNT